MPHIATRDDARLLRDRLVKDAEPYHTLLANWRRVTDRKMDAVLSPLKASLPKRLQEHWIPYQSPEPDNEAFAVAKILASNPTEIELLLTAKDQSLVNRAQSLEEALEALYQALMPMSLRLRRARSVVADAVAVLALDVLPPGKHAGGYADRDTLEKGAEKADDPEESDDSPQASYTRAYRKSSDHEKAYASAYDEAAAKDGVPLRLRVLNMAAFACELDEQQHITLGMEYGDKPISAVVEALEAYGVKMTGGVLHLTRGGTDTGLDALGGGLVEGDGWQGSGTCSFSDRDTVRYTQIRTPDEQVILVEGVPGKQGDKDGDGLFIRLPNPFPDGHTGYVLIEGDAKTSGSGLDAYTPMILPVLVETQYLNMARSTIMAMSYEEASREPYLSKTVAVVPPLEGTQETKVTEITGGVPSPAVEGKLERVPTTGVDLAALDKMLMESIAGYRTRDMFTGSGSSGETGIHLARVQTALLTQLQPQQTKFAAADKQWLELALAWAGATGRTIFVPWIPAGRRQATETVREAAPRKITPQDAKLPVTIRVEIGAATPETEWADKQVRQQEVAFGAYGKTTYREETGVKDPWGEVSRMAVDAIVEGLVGPNGRALTVVSDALFARAQAYSDSLFPAPQTPAAAPAGTDMGAEGGLPPQDMQTPGGDGGGGMQGLVPQPVQAQPGGIPVAPGANPIGTMG